MRIHKITYPDLENGLGFRVTIWISGCIHQCKGCHNPETWDKMSGREFTDEDKEKVFQILGEDYIQGVTFSGGDPMSYYYEDVIALAAELKERFPEKDIWLYTGYVRSDLKNDEKRCKIFDYIDVLVDGKYKESERNTSLAFRGSRNQNVYKVERIKAKGDDYTIGFRKMYGKDE